jgi:two-component system nitrate/nitrite response regulator NarL
MTSIFIVSNYPMFSRGLESLLHQEGRLKVVGHEAKIDQARKRITELQPDVVILDCTDPSPGAILPLIDILQENVGIKIMGVNLHENNLYLYQARRGVITGVEELMEVILQ